VSGMRARPGGLLVPRPSPPQKKIPDLIDPLLETRPAARFSAEASCLHKRLPLGGPSGAAAGTLPVDFPVSLSPFAARPSLGFFSVVILAALGDR